MPTSPIPSGYRHQFTGSRVSLTLVQDTPPVRSMTHDQLGDHTTIVVDALALQDASSRFKNCDPIFICSSFVKRKSTQVHRECSGSMIRFLKLQVRTKRQDRELLDESTQRRLETICICIVKLIKDHDFLSPVKD